MSVLQYFIVERIAVISWLQEHADAKIPVTYDYFKYVISDLGAHLCKARDSDKPNSTHWNCSPLFAVTDLSFIVLGFGAIFTALLITSTVLRVGGNFEKFIKEEREQSKIEDGIKKDHEDAKYAKDWRLLIRHFGGEHYGRKLDWQNYFTFLFRAFMLIAGVALVGLGSFPEDFDQGVHNATTVTFLVAAVLALIALGIIWAKPRPWTAVLLLLAAITAAYGGVALLMVLNQDPPGFPHGFYERLVVYGFIAGVAIMGYTLARGAYKARRKRVLFHAHGLSVRDGDGRNTRIVIAQIHRDMWTNLPSDEIPPR
ncbi:DUF998 domain-containing protein [Arthrobacter sp. M-10]|uniref:DUF998 domain-containing protein n=1 Tax=Arthrobacter sp. M-10 TaxID=3233037 RepID=UPI003F9229EA